MTGLSLAGDYFPPAPAGPTAAGLGTVAAVPEPSTLALAAAAAAAAGLVACRCHRRRS